MPDIAGRISDINEKSKCVKLAEQIELACLMEATARKPGNVHPAAAFDDLCYDDFVRASRAIAEPLTAASVAGIGRTVLDSVQATRAATGTNVNLGIVLLLAPLAAVPINVSLESGIGAILEGTTIEDAGHVYIAIRLAQPGGMGQVSSQDIGERPTVRLRDAMRLASDRDRIAEQYANGFQLVFEASKKLTEFTGGSDDWEDAIISLHVWILSKWPDTLIARKCGWEIAREASERAAKLFSQSETGSPLNPDQLRAFDKWLRADGHRRNPGTTADLVAAALFVALRDGLIVAPSREEIDQAANRQDSVTLLE